MSFDINGSNITTNGTCGTYTDERYIKKLTYIYEDEETKIELPYYAIGVPKGNEDYNITVMQLCNGEDTENTSSTSVTVEEPKPYKLYINGVDYDIIKDFVSGYNVNGINVTPNGNEPKEWLHISDENNYRWEANEIYTIKHYTDIGWSKEDAVNEVNRLKTELINTMKSEFMLRCEDAPFTLSFSVETDDMPYTLYVGYKEEEDGGTDYDHNIISNCTNIVEETLSINDIGIPTITSKDNEIYGNSSYIIPNNSDKCYALEPSSNCLKSPYYVAVVNSKGNTIPTNGIDLINGELNENNIGGYFAIHIIDKVMRLNCIAWSYMENIPYYNPSDSPLIGQSFTRKGLLAGILYNGISLTSDSALAQFNIQTLGSDDIEIQTYTLLNNRLPDEDAIPTKRVITGQHQSGEGEDTEYSEYIIPNTTEIPIPTYASVDKKDLELTIEDESCEITEEVYGKMNIVVSTADTIIDSRDKDNVVLVVDARNDGEETRYYAIPYNNEYGYLINKMGEGNITDYDDYGYMKYEFTEEDIRTLSQNVSGAIALSSEHPSEEDSENMISSIGWGTTGIFRLNKRYSREIPPYFIIAVSGITRCISPVYELLFYSATLTLTKRYKKNVIPREEIYEFLLEITNTGNSYYLNNYSCNVNISANTTINDITININQSFENVEQPFEMKNLNEDDSQVEGFDLDIEDLYNKLKSIENLYPNDTGLTIIEPRIVTTITDYCGLHHICGTTVNLIDETTITIP